MSYAELEAKEAERCQRGYFTNKNVVDGRPINRRFTESYSRGTAADGATALQSSLARDVFLSFRQFHRFFPISYRSNSYCCVAGLWVSLGGTPDNVQLKWALKREK